MKTGVRGVVCLPWKTGAPWRSRMGAGDTGERWERKVNSTAGLWPCYREINGWGGMVSNFKIL